MGRHAGSGRSLQRVVGALAATLVMAATVVDLPPPADAAPAQTAGPEITVEPAQNLTDGAVVSVDGSGLVPGKRYGVHQCEAGDTPIYEGCDFLENVTAVADSPEGRFSDVAFRADALLTTGRGTTDCRVDGACIVALTSEVGVVATAALQFDPAAEPAPPPRLTLTMYSDSLRDGDWVNSVGEGFVWGGDYVIRQCVTGALEQDMCDAETAWSAPLGLQDRIVRGFGVRMEIHTAALGTVDCHPTGACSLVASIVGHTNPARTASSELRFDPAASPRPTPSLRPDVSTDLVDGQTLTVRGTGVRGYRSIYQCGVEPHWGNCRQISFSLNDDSGDSFVEQARVNAVFHTEFGQIDCRVAHACLLVVTTMLGNPGSPRAARAPLHFDPDAPLLPPPTLTVTPTSGLVDGATVLVEGSGWYRSVDVRLCAANAPPPYRRWCVHRQPYWPPAGSPPEGRISTERRVTEVLDLESDDQSVDCGVMPGCVIVAHEWISGRQVTVPVSFEGAAPPRRYLDPVFGGVRVTHNVGYRDTVDAQGRPVQLKMDIYQPAGDTAAERPAIVWMHGGYFRSGNRASIAAYARDAALRGYVGISLGYRYRTDLGCCPPAWDDENFVAATHDAYDDALAGVEWLKEHATDYRIDPDTIVAGGNDAGGFTALNLAYRPATPSVAAVLAIDAAGTLGTVDRGEPPVMTFHAAIDEEFPYGLPEDTCRAAELVDVRCDAVTFDGEQLDIVATRRHEIMRKGMDFLAETVLGPRGYLDPTNPGPGPGTTTTTTSDGGDPPTTAAGAAASAAPDADLPRTGSDSLRLVRLGLALAISGTALTLLARRRPAG